MAMTVQECRQMIDACQKNKVQLTIGYRMQHEPVTQTIIGYRKTKPYGNIKTVFAEAGFYNRAGDPAHWKLHKELGGGAMLDMGVYPLNAARYTTGMEPVAVSARTEFTRPDLFKADERTLFQLEFPEGITANCKTSFADSINTLRVNCEKGWYQLKPFQAYGGVTGVTSDKRNLYAFTGNQQARQMDDDALSIINKQSPLVPGEEGMRDIKVVEAIFKSAAEGGKRVLI
jgi:glucose-fructose oxidoreductase